MNYMGDSIWWNERFKNRKKSIMSHEKCLEEDTCYFHSKGSLLDIACGDGRNAIYLAKLGYDVYAVDFSEEAIKRLNYFAQIEKLSIKTALTDLTKESICSIGKCFDTIIINHYRLKPEMYGDLLKCLNEEGILWINGFRDIPEDNKDIGKSDILQEEDFSLLNSCRLVDKKIYELNNRKFARYIWKNGTDKK